MSPPLPINSCVIEDWFHGIYTALMFTTVWLIVSKPKTTGSHKVSLLLWVILPYICSSMHAALNWLYYSRAVDDNELPGGPGLLFSLTHLPAWLEGTGDAFFCLNIVLADCLFIWRCWIIWGRNWLVVTLPVLSTISGAVLGGLSTANQVLALQTKEAFTAAKHSESFVRLSTAFFCLSMATSITTTLLILIRILMVQRGSTEKGLTTNRYNRVMEIIVESAMLYTATLIIFVALNVSKNPNEFYGINVHAQVAGLAPLLITLRVAAGMSRPKEEWESARASGSVPSVLRFVTPTINSTMNISSGMGGSDGSDEKIMNISKDEIA